MNLQASLECSLKNLKLPSILANYSKKASEALDDKDSYEQYLYNLTSLEEVRRLNNRIKYLLSQAKFPRMKLLDDYDFSMVDIPKETIIEICHGHFLENYTNLIFFGTPGSGKTHLAIAIGRELCLKGKKVKFFTACELTQELIKAKNKLTLTQYLKKLEGFDLLIIDELGYVPFEKEEADLLFQLISSRYEKKSILITTNLAFSQWVEIFKDPLVTSATVDRLIHYSRVFEVKQVESYRSLQAKKNLKSN